MFYPSEELYQDFNEYDEWHQGDIIEDLYITRVVEDDMYIYRSKDLERISYISEIAKRDDKVLQPFGNKHRREYALLPVVRTDVMLVSQTCDIVAKNKEDVIVARVHTFQESDNKGFLESIRRGNIFRAFYLPSYPSNDKESYSDLTKLTVISRKILDAHKAKRKKMLSSKGLRLFQFWVERLFGREAMPDDVSRIITNFNRELRKKDIWDKVAKVYYDYSSEQISLIVALNQTDDEAGALVEDAKNVASASIEHNYEVTATNRLIDDIVLRDIDGFREFR